MSRSALESKLKWKKLLWIIISWLLIGVILTFYDYFNFHSRVSLGPNQDYTFLHALILNCAVGFFASLMGGSFLVFVVNEQFRERPYWQTIFFVALSFAVVSSSLIVGVSFVMAVSKVEGWPSIHVFLSYVSDSAHLKNVLVWCIVVVLTQITLQINDKFGQGIYGTSLLANIIAPKRNHGYSCLSISLLLPGLLKRLVIRNTIFF